MRQVLQSAVVLLVVAVILGGCRSDSTSSNSNNNTTVSSGMTATINGKSWSGQVVGFRHAGPLNNLQFEGWVTTPFQQIPIGVSPTIKGPGTYPFVTNQSAGYVASVSYNITTASYSQIIDGSLTITVLTATNVQGTFQFRAISGMGDTVVVTNGQFNVPLS